MSANAGYDLNLLAAAPATGAELQVHLFSASNRHTNNVFGFIGRVLESSGIIFSRSLGWECKRDLHLPPPVPSWKTKKRAIVIVGVAIVVSIAIIVGAVVGKSHKNHSSYAANSATTSGIGEPAPSSVGTLGQITSFSFPANYTIECYRDLSLIISRRPQRPRVS